LKHSYNGCLCGMGLGIFLSGDWYLKLVAILIVSFISIILSVSLENFFVQHHNVAPLTFPFNFATIIFLLGAYKFSYFDIQMNTPTIVSKASSDVTFDSIDFVLCILRGIGQVFLADNPASGGLILIGILFCSRISGLFAVIGSLVGASVAYGLGVDPTQIVNGLWGYNAVLGASNNEK